MAGGGRKMAQLSSSDRCWVVAGLTVLGLTAGDIADRLDCSLRLVRSIRSDDMTAVCVYALTESTNFASEMRLAQSHLRSQSSRITELSGELERTRSKLSRMIDTHVGVRNCPKCGTRMDRWNEYVCNGKSYCRACHRERQKMYRNRQREVAGLPFALARG
jgi:hypothetical protein